MFLNLGPNCACLLLSLHLVACVAPSAPPQAQPSAAPTPPVVTPQGPPPAVIGESAIVIDAITGRVLSGKNIDQQRAVASTQKLLTALVVVDDGPLTDEVTIEGSDTAVEPTKIYLRPGDVHTRDALLKAILVRSANDAATALARDVGGTVEAFVEKMNRRARALGMNNSHFKNPHGLTEEGQFSTARDIAKLARVAYQRSAIRGPVKLPSYVFTHNDGKTRTLENTNKLLKRVSYANGMKTGTTRASGKCLVSSGTLNGRVVIVVVLGSTEGSVWSDSEKLMRWALELPTATPAPANPPLNPALPAGSPN